MRLPLLIIGGWLCSGFVAGGPTIVDILYDSRYVDAGWMLQFLAIGTWFGTVLSGTNSAGVLAVGQSKWTFATALAKVLALVVLVVPFYHAWGFRGAIVAISIGEVIRYLVSTIAAVRFGMDGRLQDMKLSMLVVASSFVGWFLVAVLPASIGHGVLGGIVRVLVVFVSVTALWVPYLWPLVKRVRSGESLFQVD
ncbi:MAG: hypothetical protein R3A47_09745 [Polyangiales bacterium]